MYSAVSKSVLYWSERFWVPDFVHAHACASRHSPPSLEAQGVDPADVLAELLAAGYRLFKYERSKDERGVHVWGTLGELTAETLAQAQRGGK